MLNKQGIDQQALVDLFTTASAKQTAQLKDAVSKATLQALEGREMTLKNLRGVIKSVTEAASQGAAKNATPKVNVEAMLATAVAGIDDALLKAVEANRIAMERFIDQGVSLQDSHLKKALGDLDKFEDTMLSAIRKASESASTQLAAPWRDVLGKFESAGSLTGAQASATIEQLTEQMQTQLREGRQASIKAAMALANSYTAMVSGVLIGLSDAMRQGSAKAGKK